MLHFSVDRRNTELRLLSRTVVDKDLTMPRQQVLDDAWLLRYKRQKQEEHAKEKFLHV